MAVFYEAADGRVSWQQATGSGSNPRLGRNGNLPKSDSERFLGPHHLLRYTRRVVRTSTTTTTTQMKRDKDKPHEKDEEAPFKTTTTQYTETHEVTQTSTTHRCVDKITIETNHDQVIKTPEGMRKTSSSSKHEEDTMTYEEHSQKKANKKMSRKQQRFPKKKKQKEEPSTFVLPYTEERSQARQDLLNALEERDIAANEMIRAMEQMVLDQRAACGD